MKPGESTQNLMLTALMLLLTACASLSESPPTAVDSVAEAGTCLNGFSGMENIDDERYLVVHDRKAHRSGHRLSLIQTMKDKNFTVIPIQVDDWKHSDGPASDLEGICKIPQRENEYLAVESGQWDGEFGRLFHLVLNTNDSPPNASVIHAHDLPVFDAKGPDDPHGDEFEGLECATIDQDTVLVILGERGGSLAHSQGTLRWATLDLTRGNLEWDQAGRNGVEVDAPGVWVDSTRNRDITALHLDDEHVLWAIASEDAGEAGPFRSLLYRIGTVAAGEANPIRLSGSFAVTRRSDGLKIEALAGPSDPIPGSRFAIATEDECFGGVWRPLK